MRIIVQDNCTIFEQIFQLGAVQHLAAIQIVRQKSIACMANFVFPERNLTQSFVQRSAIIFEYIGFLPSSSVIYL